MPPRWTPTIPSMDESWILIDPGSGLHVSWYFWLRVLDEVNRAARYGDPFALLLLEAEVAPGKPDRLVNEAAAFVPGAIRSTDLGGILGRGAAAVLLTHQDPQAAGAARDRVLGRLSSACPADVEWRSELLCYPADAAGISNLLTGGWERRPGAPRTDVGLSA
jgi:hypothetical protein